MASMMLRDLFIWLMPGVAILWAILIAPDTLYGQTFTKAAVDEIMMDPVSSCGCACGANAEEPLIQ